MTGIRLRDGYVYIGKNSFRIPRFNPFYADTDYENMLAVEESSLFCHVRHKEKTRNRVDATKVLTQFLTERDKTERYEEE